MDLSFDYLRLILNRSHVQKRRKWNHPRSERIDEFPRGFQGMTAQQVSVEELIASIGDKRPNRIVGFWWRLNVWSPTVLCWIFPAPAIFLRFVGHRET
jgi:hypothetical protein